MFDKIFTRVAAAPISWGVCEVPGWGYQLTADRVLAEMAELGFTHTELGSAGWLPRSAPELRSLLEDHRLHLLASFVPLVLHDRAAADRSIADAIAAADLLAACGATCFNTAPVTSLDWGPRRPYSDDEWRHLYAMLTRIEELCRDRGLTQVVHEHVGCVVETADEVSRVLDNTDVSLVLDTGHLSIGGYDPLVLATEHSDRVGLVHLKDTRKAVADALNRGELSLMAAVQDGLFPPLGQGDLPLADIVTTLERSGYGGWYVIEQDCALGAAEPPPGEGPLRDVAASIDYVTSLSPVSDTA